MKKGNLTDKQSLPTNDIPDIEIIDLENDGDFRTDQIKDEDDKPDNSKIDRGKTKDNKPVSSNADQVEDGADKPDRSNADQLKAGADKPDRSNADQVESKDDKETTEKKAGRGWRSFLNIHVLFAASVILIIAGIFWSVSHWGIRIDLDEIFKDGPGEYSDTFDSILPLLTDVENPADDGITTIVCFGNAPFADDRDSEDNLANIIAKQANATVYNCAISGSYLASKLVFYNVEEAPIDAYNFYWLTHLAVGSPIEHFFTDTAKALGPDTPKEADEVLEILTTLDFNTVDVIAIMYDASDYLAGSAMYDDADHTNITCFTGNMEAGIELIKDVYPHIRIIVMSPTYAYALDDNGDYLSSDIVTYGWDVLPTYVIKQSDSASYQGVTFIDNLYGTINADNAPEYLTDHIHLNVEGRKKVAQRFVDALTYFDQK